MRYRYKYLSSILLMFIFVLFFSSFLLSDEKKTENITTPDTLNIKNALETTLKNNEQLKLVSQELTVLQSKLTESRRNIFPNISLKAEKTDGLAEARNGVPGFEEQSYTSQINWSIFEGGRITALFKQSKLNFFIGQLKYTKTKQELIYNTEEAYWNTARFMANLKNYESASKDVKNYFNMAKKMYASNNISKKEMLNTESQYNQAIYQIETTKKDIENQVWILAEAMGLDFPPKNYPDSNIPAEKLALDLEKCLALCDKFHPDILTQNLLIDVNKYSLKIKNSYKLPKLTVQGSYGKSGGAYNSEKLNLNEDYYAGLQLSQVFMLNTLSVSDINQKTSPKVGQSTVSESHTSSAQLSILDNYKQLSEKKEAELAYNQAVYNLKKTKFTVESEVRKTFTNYSKALLQIQNTQLEINILKQELDIAKVTLGTDKTNIADIATAINKYASGQAALSDAKVFYLISVAALKKAVGADDKIYN